MSVAIKAIETRYNGYRFRSRLEARWAVFFDQIGLPYRYEPEGFDLEGMWYLPDFYTSLGFIEIKPFGATNHEFEKVIRLCLTMQAPVTLLYGDVWPQAYTGYAFLPTNLIEKEEVIKSINQNYANDDPPSLHWHAPDQVLRIVNEKCYFVADLRRSFVSFFGFFEQCLTCHAVFLPCVRACKCGREQGHYSYDTPFLKSAYITARSARFEHGEKP